MSTIVVTLLAAPVLFFALWHLTSSLTPPPPPALLRNKRIILLIAHPDDESMFFAPTLQSLTAPHLQNHLKILCLSTGNADGLGDARRKELEAAALTLGVRRREDVFVMNDESKFKDGMNENWSETEISKVLASAFAPQLNTPSSSPPPPSSKEKDKTTKIKSSKKSTKTTSTSTPTKFPSPVPEGPRATIDVLITFDKSGISSHPNHISLYHGAKLFLSNLMRGHSGYSCPVTLYTLSTVNIARKYSFILDAIPTYISGIIGNFQSAKGKKGDRVLFISDMMRYWKARDAMVNGHKSQMVWFRWGWIGVGRYMVVNDLRREGVS